MKLLTSLLLLLMVPGADDWSDFQKLWRDKDFMNRCKAVDAIKKYKDKQMAVALLPMLADENIRVVFFARKALGSVTDLEAVKVLENAVQRHRDPRVKAGVAEALGMLRRDSSVDALIKALKDPKPEVSGWAAWALGEIGPKSAVDALVKSTNKKKWFQVAMAIEALGKIDPASAEEPCEQNVRSRDHQIRMVVAETAPKVGTEFALGLFPKLIEDKDWRVRVSAIESCVEIRHKDVIEPLIEGLKKEKGRLRWDIAMVLKDLTDRDLGLEYVPWKSWWDGNKDRFEIAKKDNKKDSRVKTGSTVSSFFEVPIVSTRIIFILDLSGSMRDNDAPVDSKGRSTNLKMIDVAKQGMIEAIQPLKKDVWFGITGLGGWDNHTFPWKDQKTWRTKMRLHPAAPRNVAEAVKWIRGLEARGYSNDYDTLMHAYTDMDVDTIYLYSDGGTSRGTFVRRDDQLFHMNRENRWRKIMIHTIEVPGQKENTKTNIRFLKELAGDSKGLYKLYESKK